MLTTAFRNIGPIERGIRVAVGLALITVALVVPGALWGYLGFIPLATGLVGWCPLYSVIAYARGKRPAR
jgi:hypothetical protein